MGDYCDLDKTQLRIKRNMKRETRKTIVKEVGESHQVTIVKISKIKKDKTIMRERGILTTLIKRLVRTQGEENDINPELRKRVDGRNHQINQVQWRP